MHVDVKICRIGRSSILYYNIVKSLIILDEDTAIKTLGKWAGWVVDIMCAFGNFLYLVAYLILLGDFGVELMTYILGYAPNRIYVILTIGSACCYPLSLLSSINSLRFTR
jgi:amino acid permease